MINTGLTVRAWNDAAIARRDEDGYANATAMCQANGKLWKHYNELARTQSYIQALAASLDLTPAALVITTTTGPNEFRGTWIHPRLAVDLARWISPEFAVWMDGWFLEQLEHQQQPQAPGLTADDVARIMTEAMRAAAPVMPAMPALSVRKREDITSRDAIISVLADFHSMGHAVVSRRTLKAEVARRYGYAPHTLDNTISTLLSRRRVIRVRPGRFRLPVLPPATAVKALPPVLHADCSQLELMQIIRQCAAEASGPVTWHDVIDRTGAEAWPGIGRVWEAMEALAALGAGVFRPDLKSFRLAA